MIVNYVLPQVAAQIGEVSTFGKETSPLDLSRITAAQKSCDRFLAGLQSIAVEEMMTNAVLVFVELVIGEDFQPDKDGVWSWEFPNVLGSTSDLAVILLALGGLANVAPVLESKKRKAPEPEEDKPRTSLNNEALLDAFPTLVGATDEDKIRNMMKSLDVNPASLRDQQQLKDAASAIASGTDPKQLHTTASGEPRDISGLNNLFRKNTSDLQQLHVTGDGQIVSRTMGSPDNRFLWTMKANQLIDSLPRHSEARKKAIIYRDSFGLMGEYFSWETVMAFDSHFRELIASGAPVDLTMNSIHSLFLLQHAARTQNKSGDYEPATANKRFRGEQSDYSMTRASQDYGAKTKSKGYCTYFQKSNPEGGHKCRKQNCQFLHKCTKCSESGHGAYACKKKKS
jgi:hypothetical protein